jgi:hypothetical protein
VEIRGIVVLVIVVGEVGVAVGIVVLSGEVETTMMRLLRIQNQRYRDSKIHMVMLFSLCERLL